MHRVVRGVLVVTTALALAACTGGTQSQAPGGATASPGGSTAAADPCIVASSAGSVAASIADFSFSPEPIQAKKGDTVTWTSGGSAPHTATLDNFPACATQTLNKGQSGSITFSVAGTYTYHCTIHPTRMKGSIVVAP